MCDESQPLTIYLDSSDISNMASAADPFWREARDALKGRTVELVYVPGHSGVPMNERADELARTAIREERTVKLPRF